MREIKKLLTLLFCMAFVVNANARDESFIEYINIFGGEQSVFSVGHSEVKMLDLSYDLARCPPESEFICISSEILTFSVPKSFPRLTHWVQSGATYELRGSRVADILGRKVKYWIIRQTWGEASVDFAYSPSRGVLSLRSKDGQIILKGSCGIAPQVDSVDCRTKH